MGNTIGDLFSDQRQAVKLHGQMIDLQNAGHLFQADQIRNHLKLIGLDSWFDGLITPLVEALQKLMPNETLRTIGPQGLTCGVWITTAQSGDTTTPKWSVNVRPNGDLTGLAVVDYSHDSGEFPKGSIGEINRMNYAEIEIDEWTVEELIEWGNQIKKKGGE